jgi:hypothetical protein
MNGGIERIKDACAYITTDSSRGTGYLVSHDEVVTCWHVTNDRKSIQVKFKSQQRAATVIGENKQADWAVLKLDRPLNDIQPLPLEDNCLRGAPWEAYGFPAINGESPLWLTGDVVDADIDAPGGGKALLLYSREAGGAKLQGFSGTPVLVGGKVVGHLKRIIPDDNPIAGAAMGMIYACPVKSLKTGFPSKDSQTNKPPVHHPYTEQWYIKRAEAENRVTTCLEKIGKPTLIWAPGRSGKTMLLQHIFNLLESEPQTPPFDTCFVSFTLFPEECRYDIRKFMYRFSKLIARDVGYPTEKVDHLWKKHYGTLNDVVDDIMQNILDVTRNQLILFLDELDAIFWWKIEHADFFRLLRGWAENKKGAWSRLRIVSAISTTPSLLGKGKDSPFTNATEQIYLEDFDEEGVKNLCKLYGVSLDESQKIKLIEYLGGNPYLIRLTMWNFASNQTNSLNHLLEKDPDGIFNDYLDKYRCLLEPDPKLEADSKLKETFSIIQKASQTAANEQDRSVDASSLNRQACYRLERAGLIKEEPAGKYKLRYKLYERL